MADKQVDETTEMVMTALASQPRTVPPSAAEMLDALKLAKQTIRTWHGMGIIGRTEAQAWELYQASPEMKQINAALAAAPAEPEEG